MVKGLDIYEGTGHLDFAKVKADGYAFVIAKATEGATYKDSKFAEYYKAIAEAGLIRGSYCFARPKTSTAVEEASAYVATVNAAGGFSHAIPPILDIEDDKTGFSPAQMQEFCLDWAREVKRQTGLKPILYSYPDFIRRYGLNSPAIQEAFDLWIASYQGVPDTAGWKSWEFQQQTGRGVEQGVTVDIDAFNGTLEDLERYCGIQPKAPAAPATPDHTPATPFGARAKYTVHTGDTLSAISARYNVPVGVLARYNNIPNPNVIQVGQVIYIPSSYRVRPGDTLSGKFGEHWPFVAKVNNINPDRIFVGQILYY
jgi:GH25 family lysozyme M1 (1,4-beta-N-acetylmuramidase)